MATKSFNRKHRLARLVRASEKAKQRAEYLGSVRGLAAETIKGMPEAAKKIALTAAQKAKYYLGGRGYGQQRESKWITPEGKKLQEMIKQKGVIKSILESRQWRK